MPRTPRVGELSPDALEARRKYHREYARSYRKNTDVTLRTRYGITKAEKAELLEAQGGVCAICSSEASHVDHCHTSGVVRGVLCMACNTALGSFRDSPTLLKNAIAYLNAA